MAVTNSQTTHATPPRFRRAVIMAALFISLQTLGQEESVDEVDTTESAADSTEESLEDESSEEREPIDEDITTDATFSTDEDTNTDTADSSESNTDSEEADNDEESEEPTDSEFEVFEPTENISEDIMIPYPVDI